jgi:hypothetical protein
MNQAIAPVNLFSVAQDMAANANDSDLKLESVADAFIAANSKAQAQINELNELVSQDNLGPRELFKLTSGMKDLSTRSNLFSHMVTEATKGFKTLTQQS